MENEEEEEAAWEVSHAAVEGEVTCMRVSKKACAGPGRGAPTKSAVTLGNSLRRLARPGGRWSGGAGTRGASGLGRLFVLAWGSRSRESQGAILPLPGSSLECSVKRTTSADAESCESCTCRGAGEPRDACPFRGVCGLSTPRT